MTKIAAVITLIDPGKAKLEYLIDHHCSFLDKLFLIFDKNSPLPYIEPRNNLEVLKHEDIDLERRKSKIYGPWQKRALENPYTESVIARQVLNADVILRHLKETKEDYWLIQIDADELLYGDIKGLISQLEYPTSQLVLLNHEAIYRTTDNDFRNVNHFKKNPKLIDNLEDFYKVKTVYFCAYRRGKSFTRVKYSKHPNGNHLFYLNQGHKTYTHNDIDIGLLHFPRWSLAEYIRKFNRLSSNKIERWRHRVPNIEFYLKSRDLSLKRDEEGLEEYYRKELVYSSKDIEILKEYIIENPIE
jgi:hypothetical protein